ncbi:hypothetical protein BGW41_006339 [Actinomortierella wolfii]|nr:hypothetical protein BGW41_006339 [Actinomortierella wolfii]
MLDNIEIESIDTDSAWASWTPRPAPTPRTQRAHSMATDTLRIRDSLHLSSKLESTPIFDHYLLPSSPAVDPQAPSRQEVLQMERDRRKQIHAKLQLQQQQAQELARREKEARRQAKQDRKLQKEESKKTHDMQYQYQQQQSSDPSSLSSSAQRISYTPLPNMLPRKTKRNMAPNIEPLNIHSDLPDNRAYSITTSSSKSSIAETASHPAERGRSQSMRASSKHLPYNLWSNAPQSPTVDHVSGYESDDTGGSSNTWDNMREPFYSPSSSFFPGSDTTSFEAHPRTAYLSMSHQHKSPSSPSLGPSVSDTHAHKAHSSNFEDDDELTTCLQGLSLTSSSSSGNGKYLLVLGANGRTGIELVRQALERNYRVTAFVRDDKALLADSNLRKNHNLLIVRGSPTTQADVDRAVEGQDVVVNVIGPRFMSGDSPICSHSQVVLQNAMKKHGVRRLLVVTSYGCYGLRSYLLKTRCLFIRMFMVHMLKDKSLQEDIIRRESAHFDWTIIRPIQLKDGRLTGRYHISEGELPRNAKIRFLARRDLAHFVISNINNPSAIGAIRSIAGKPKDKTRSSLIPPHIKREVARSGSPAHQAQS